MKRMLFNARQAEELRVAIVDGQKLLDLDIETLGKEQRKGNIYTGIITRIEPSLEACFVDYGTDRHGFLPFKEVSRAYFQDYEGGRARIQDVLKEGMHIIVQVEKDERGNKGAALTTFISLAGRYLVLMPNNPRGGGVSRRIEGEERAELKEAMAQLDVPSGMSIIARTAGIGRSAEELQWDFNYLLQLWRAIEAAATVHKQPYLLFMESSLVIRAIRDYFRPDISEILVDNPEVYEQVSEFMSYVMPNNLGRLKLYTDHTPLFSRLQIEHQIETAFARSVNLPSGGAIVIDHTEALVSIDVNSARSTRGADIEETAFRTNMEAAEEVARQMRLRDLGGLVVIDFIDMEDAKHQRDVETVLRDALKKDRARVQMGKLSRFGLLELSRQRLQPALTESSHIACPRCAGTGVIRSIESTALHVLRLIQDAAMKENTGEVHVQVPVDVATFLLNEKRAELFGMEERLDVSVFLIPNTNLENPHYEITRIRNDDVEENAEPSYKRVTQPEKQETVPFSNSKGEKAARLEPAVKGLKHASPAPTVKPERKSLLSGIANWFKNLFSGSQNESETKDKKKAVAQTLRTSNKRNNPNRRQTKRRQEENANNNVTEQKNKRHHVAEETNIEQAGHDNHVHTTPINQERKHNQRQRNKDDTREVNTNSPQQPVAKNNQPIETNEKSDNNKTERKNRKQKPLVIQLGKEPRPKSEPRNNRRTQQQSQRGIPSAAKMEHFLDITACAQIVEAGVEHVLTQNHVLPMKNDLDSHTSQSQPTLTEPVASQITMQPETTAITAKETASANNHDDLMPTSLTANTGLIAIEHNDDELMTAETTVPSAAITSNEKTIIQTCDNTQSEDNVPLAQQLDDVTTTDAVMIETEESTSESTHTITTSNETTQPNDRRSIMKLAQSLDLNDLQLIETNPGALIAAAARLEPKPQPRLHRSDMPAPIINPAPVEMIQVETLKS